MLASRRLMILIFGVGTKIWSLVRKNIVGPKIRSLVRKYDYWSKNMIVGTKKWLLVRKNIICPKKYNWSENKIVGPKIWSLVWKYDHWSKDIIDDVRRLAMNHLMMWNRNQTFITKYAHSVLNMLRTNYTFLLSAKPLKYRDVLISRANKNHS